MTKSVKIQGTERVPRDRIYLAHIDIRRSDAYKCKISKIEKTAKSASPLTLTCFGRRFFDLGHSALFPSKIEQKLANLETKEIYKVIINGLLGITLKVGRYTICDWR